MGDSWLESSLPTSAPTPPHGLQAPTNVDMGRRSLLPHMQLIGGESEARGHP